MKNQKPVVGQIVYSLPIGNAARGRKAELTPMTVAKVGRRYFYAAKAGHEEDKYSNTHVKASFKTWVEHSNWAGHKFYASAREWEDKRAKDKLEKAFRCAFGGHGQVDFDLQALRQAAEILGIEVEE